MKDRTVKLADFGESVLVNTKLQKESNFGTPLF
jgi:hypothetical protein